MPTQVSADERAMRLGNVAAILIELGRRARLAAESEKETTEAQPAPAQEGDPT